MAPSDTAEAPPDEAPLLPRDVPVVGFGSNHMAGRAGVTVFEPRDRVRLRFTEAGDEAAGWSGWLTPSQAVQLAQNLLAAVPHCRLPPLHTRKATPE